MDLLIMIGILVVVSVVYVLVSTSGSGKYPREEPKPFGDEQDDYDWQNTWRKED